MRTALGFDIGTTSLKGVLVDEAGNTLAMRSHDYPVYTPHPGWSEQDSADWWSAVIAVARELGAVGPKPDAIGLTGQMHGSVFLDGAGGVLTRAILWNDQRSADECAAIDRLSEGRMVEWTLNPVRTAFTATKILWVRQHLPDVYARIAGVLLPKDYVRFRLSGDRVTDVTDASGTALFDVRARDWSAPALAALEIPPEWLPRAVESVDVTGVVSADAASVTGLPTGTPIVGGAADQAAAAIGTGVNAPGVLSITIGTSGVVYAQIADVIVDPTGAFHTFCHAVPNTWQVMAGVLSAGGSFQWYRQVCGEPEATAAAAADRDPYDAICADAALVPPGAGGLVFLPYLTGERSPHNDPEARGCWLGLTTRHERRHMARAVIEGVCFALRDLVTIADEVGVPIADIRVAGGGARGPLWLRILADVLGRPVRPAFSPDASARGAAALAMAAVGDGDVAAVAEAWTQCGEPIAPIAANADLYEAQYGIFRDLYPAPSRSCTGSLRPSARPWQPTGGKNETLSRYLIDEVLSAAGSVAGHCRGRL